METKRRVVGLLLVALLGLAPWSAVASAAELAGIVAIDILTTNDVHGALVESGRNPGMAKFSTFFYKEQAKNPYGTIFLSAGDMFQGSPDSNLLYGKTMVEVLNALQMGRYNLGQS